MMVQGQESKFRCRSSDDCGSWRRNCIVRAQAHRYPVCSSGRTAIEVPGFGKHSHQLGSNPAESKAQLLTLPGPAALPKLKRKQSAPSKQQSAPRTDRRKLMADCGMLISRALLDFDRGAGVDEL